MLVGNRYVIIVSMYLLSKKRFSDNLKSIFRYKKAETYFEIWDDIDEADLEGLCDDPDTKKAKLWWGPKNEADVTIRS